MAIRIIHEELQPGHQLTWLEYFIAFLSHSMKMLG
jgi:hypothetical protein